MVRQMSDRNSQETAAGRELKRETMKRKYYSYKKSHRTFRGVDQKRCTICTKWKAESYFHKDRARTDGLKIRCKACERVYQQQLAGKDGKNIRAYVKIERRHRTVRGVKQKLCSRCKKWNDEGNFYKNRLSPDGSASYCKPCHSKYDRKRLEQRNKDARKYIRFEDRHRVVKRVRQKLCRKCNRWKDESEFYKNRAEKDGLDYQCKKCSYTPVGRSRKK